MSDTGSLDKAILEPMALEVPILTSNQAFRSWELPYGHFLEHNDPEYIAQRVEDVVKQLQREYATIGPKLRNMVVEQHSLPQTIETMVQKLSK